MLGMWTANRYLAWKNRKKLDFNNEVILGSKYASSDFKEFKIDRSSRTDLFLNIKFLLVNIV